MIGDGPEAGHQRHRRREQQHLREDHGAPPVIPVRHMSGEKREQQKRRHLHESDVAQHHARICVCR